MTSAALVLHFIGMAGGVAGMLMKVSLTTPASFRFASLRCALAGHRSPHPPTRPRHWDNVDQAGSLDWIALLQHRGRQCQTRRSDGKPDPRFNVWRISRRYVCVDVTVKGDLRARCSMGSRMLRANGAKPFAAPGVMLRNLVKLPGDIQVETAFGVSERNSKRSCRSSSSSLNWRCSPSSETPICLCPNNRHGAQ